METLPFSPDLVLREAATIIDRHQQLPTKELTYSTYNELAQMLMGFRPDVRRRAIGEICEEFELNKSELKNCVRNEEFDAECERTMLESRSFTLSQYIALISKTKKK